jgi:hypothetical protein
MNVVKTCNYNHGVSGRRVSEAADLLVESEKVLLKPKVNNFC